MFNLLNVSLHSTDIVCAGNAVQMQRTVKYEGFLSTAQIKIITARNAAIYSKLLYY
jgi:hypothetical protein